MAHPTLEDDNLTQLLVEASGGNVDALNRLLPLVYSELRRIAHNRLRDERAGHTLSTTALVHEAYLKLVGYESVQWQSRAHFYAVSSRAMQRILVNYAEMTKAAKRGGTATHVALEDAGLVLDDAQAEEVLVIDEALLRLRAFNSRGADVVVYRFFGGLSADEIAEVLGVSTITVHRAWAAAKTWLRRELREALPDWESQRLGGTVVNAA
ncbi:MAG: ECF-type sigma factor [Gemmatimonadaceae bacterium]